MKNKKALLSIALFMIYLVVVMPISFAMVINPGEVEVDKTSARINWTTDVPAYSRVNYGTSKENINQRVTDWSYKTEHSLLIQRLIENTTYYYDLEGSNADGTDKATHNASNEFFSFTTLPDLLEFSLSTPIPEYTNNVIDVVGNVNPGAEIRIYLDGVIAAGTDSSTGRFSFYGIQLDETKTTRQILKIISLYNDQIQELIYNITFDNIDPEVELKVNGVLTETMPEVSGVSTITIAGEVNEQVEVEITVDNEVKSTFPASPTANFTGTVDLEEGNNDVRVVFTDKAGNQKVFENTIFVDSTAPEILDTNLNVLTPSYTNFVTVTGSTNKPNSKIIVFVNNETTSDGFFTTSIGDWIRHSFKTAEIGGDLDYVSETDAIGNFSVEIELTKDFRIQGADVSLEGEETPDGQAWSNEITILLVDSIGRNASVSSNIDYATCGAGGDWFIKWGFPSPTTLREQMLRASGGLFSMELDFEWMGGGDPDSAILRTARMSLRDDFTSRAETEEYQLENNLLAQTIFTLQLDNAARKGYVLIPLKKLTAELEETDKLADTEKLTFPFKLEVNYAYKDPYTQKSGTRTQKECNLVNINIERVVPPGRLVNENLVNAALKFISFTQKTFVKLGEFVNKLMPKVTIICLSSFLAKFLFSASTTVNVARTGYFPGIPETDSKLKELSKYVYDEREATVICNDEKINKDFLLKAKDENDDVEQKCEQALGYLKSYQMWEKLSAGFCDRIACPPAPTIEKHVESFHDTVTRNKISNCCEKEEKSKCVISFKPSDLGNLGEGNTVRSQQMQRCKNEYTAYWGLSCLLPPGDDTDWKIFGKSEWVKATQFDPDRALGTSWCNRPYVPIVGRKENEIISDYYTISCKEVKGKFQFNHKECRDEFNERYKPDQGIDGNCFYTVDNGEIQQLSCENGEIISKSVDNEDELKKEIEDIRRKAEGKGVDYVEDSASNILASMRCGCLTGVASFINQWNSILEATKECLVKLKKDKEAAAGVCKTVMTQYLCDLIYKALKCVSQMMSYGMGKTLTRDKEKGLGIGGGIKLINFAGQSVGESIKGRYGASSMYKVMFNEKKLMYSICLAAFTGDWDFQGMIDSMTDSFKVSIDSTGFFVFPERSFLTSSPIPPASGKATFAYNFGLFFTAGSDLDYNIYLVCSGDNSCGRYAEARTSCDCADIGERTLVVRTGTEGSLGSGKLSEGDSINDEWYEIVRDSPYRYDKIRLVYRYTKADSAEQKKIEADIKQSGLEAPATCSWNLVYGQFLCSFSVGQRADAFFTSARINGVGENDVLGIGNVIKVDYTVSKASPGTTQNTNQNIAPGGQAEPVWVGYELRNQANVLLRPEQFTKIEPDGVQTAGEQVAYFPTITIEEAFFGQAAQINPISISVVSSQTTVQLQGNPVISPNAVIDSGTYKIEWVKNNNDFQCKVSKSTSQGSTNFGAVSKTLTGVNCTARKAILDGITFNLRNDAQNQQKVTFNAVARSVTGGSTVCNGQEETWKASLKLYQAKKQDNVWVRSGMPVLHAGQEQKRDIAFKVKCGVGSNQGEDNQDPNIDEFRLYNSDGAAVSSFDLETDDFITINYTLTDDEQLSRFKIIFEREGSDKSYTKYSDVGNDVCNSVFETGRCKGSLSMSSNELRQGLTPFSNGRHNVKLMVYDVYNKEDEDEKTITLNIER